MTGFLPPDDLRRYPKTPRVSAHTMIKNDDGDKVLLIKRGGNPWKGTWAPPGGGVELGETVYEAGKREVMEEAGVEVEIDGVQKIDDRIRLDNAGKVESHTIIIRLMSRYISGTPKAGSDAADIGWFGIDDLDGLEMDPKAKELVIQALSG